MSHPLLTRTWERDEVVEDLRTALDIVSELEPDEDLRLQTFTFAVQLVTQRAQRTPIGIALPQPPQG